MELIADMPPRSPAALTDADARAARGAAKVYKLAAGRGMYLEVHPNGSRYWRFKFRFAGKEKRLAFGVYPDITLKRANQLREQARTMIENGLDPSVERKVAKLTRAQSAASSFEAIAGEWLKRQAGASGKPLADITVAKNTWLMESFAFPHIGSRAISEITAPEILALCRRVEVTGKHETANRLRVKLSQVFRYAIQTGRAERDPASDIRGALKAPATKHRAAITDPKKIGALLRAIWSYEGQPISRAALQLAALTFVRPGELRGARWEEIDLKEGTWRIPAERMKMRVAHAVPLAPQAVAVLEALHPLTRRSDFVFPSVRTWKRSMSENTVNAALRRLGYAADEVVGHGFRTTASTRLNELGWNADLIERQLAHVERNKVRGAYNRAEHLDERRKMMVAWADYLDGLRGGGEVVALRRKKSHSA